MFGDKKLIKEHIQSFYEMLFTERQKCGVKECKWIQRPFTEEDVVDAHKQFDGDIAPGT